MTSSSIQPRALVLDRHGRAGIVREKERTPDQHWIDSLHSADEIKQLGPTDWWGVMPLDGGYVLSPEPLLTYLREATYEDFLAAADGANAAGRKSLVRLFPDYVNRLLAERDSRES